MATAMNTLYPPVVSTFMNAFIYNEDARVYFSISQYNSANDISVVQYSVVNQLNNENATTDSSGILFSTLNGPDANNGLYYIDIPVSSIRGGQFNINQYYKVQLRFDNNGGQEFDFENVSSAAKKNAYLLNNQANFSEWSSVCLIRPILYPHIQVKLFDNYAGNGIQALQKGIIPISGGIYFDRDNEERKTIDRSETETMLCYKIEVFPEDSTVANDPEYENMSDEEKMAQDDAYLSTGEIYTGSNLDPNDINYRLDIQTMNVNEGDILYIRITVTTKNQYTFSKIYKFQVGVYSNINNFQTSITAEMNNEDGVVTLHINASADLQGGIFYVKRLSSLDKFKSAELFYSQYYHTTVNNLILLDNTVQSLVWYRYSIQYESEGGVMSPVVYSEAIMPDFHDATFSRGDKQYTVRYNYNISSLKPVVNRAKINTLGGKYPRFAENAVLNYKQFSISGTLSAEADAHQLFLSKFGGGAYSKFGGDGVYKGTLESYYQAYKSYPHRSLTSTGTGTYDDTDQIYDLVRNDFQDYKKFNDFDSWSDSNAGEAASAYGSYLTTTMNDWMWEREVRENLVAWLNDGEPKLYRSRQEGNLVVMLTDINLTPTSQTDRFLYDFSATMYEVEDASSLDTLDYLGIYDVQSVDDTDSANSVKPEGYIKVVKLGQTYKFKVSQNMLDNMNNADIIPYILNDLKMKYGYTGHNEETDRDMYDTYNVRHNFKPANLVLKNVKIFFHNKPNLYEFSGNNIFLARNNNQDNNLPSNSQSEAAMSTFRLGYSLSIRTTNGAVEQNGSPIIFVNERGYYQVPDDLDVTSLIFNHEGDVVTIEYTLVYREYNNQTEIVTGVNIDRIVIGQYDSVFQPDRYQGEFIRTKYNFVSDNNYRQYMEYWSGISLDVTPFALCKIKYQGVTGNTEYVVGSTGVLRMLQGFPVNDIVFQGRRMAIIDDLSRQPYLDNWECVLDESVTNSDAAAKAFNWFTVVDQEDTGEKVVINTENLSTSSITNGIIPIASVKNNSTSSIGKIYRKTSEIKHPKYNTVYLINNKMKIYYIDGNWYDFQFLSRDDITDNTAQDRIGLAKVPISGQINYCGYVIQKSTTPTTA